MSITNINTDKAFYNPGNRVKISVEVNDYKGSLTFEVFNRQTLMQSFSLGYVDYVCDAIWITPTKTPEQYLVRVTNNADGAIDVAHIAINVGQSQKDFPLMGFLSDYSYSDAVKQSEVMDFLKRVHINTVQYYDCLEDHSRPNYVGEHGEVSQYTTSPAKKPILRDSVNRYIELAKKNGQLSLVYGLMNGESSMNPGNGVTPDMLLYTSNTGSEGDVLRKDLLNSNFKYDLFLGDYTNPEYRKLVLDKFAETLKAYAFDGWHIDTLGGCVDKYRKNGQKISFEESEAGFKDFVDDVTNKFFESFVGMNNVARTGVEGVARSAAAYLYTELWPFDTPSYNDMFQAIMHQMAIGTADKGMIVPAYINEGGNWEGDNKKFNIPSVIMANIVIMAAGATHLEIGEQMLSNEYFPDKRGRIYGELKDFIVAQYDFTVAYHNLLGLRKYSTDKTWILGYNDAQGNFKHDSDHAKNAIVAGKFSVIEKYSDSVVACSIINTKTMNGTDWRDDEKKRQMPETIKNIRFGFSKDVDVKDGVVYYASIENPTPTKVELDGNNSFELPELNSHVLIWCERLQRQ